MAGELAALGQSRPGCAPTDSEGGSLDPSRGALAEDDSLVQRIRTGDGRAEDELVRRFEPGLRAIACVRVGTIHAGDLVQDTLAAAIVNLRRGAWKGDGPLAAYLATILRRGALRLRFGLPHTTAADLECIAAPREIDPLVIAERTEMRRRLCEAVARLPQRHRDVLLRHYFGDQEAGAIARDLGIPRGTVLSRLYHARRKLAAGLNRSCR